MVNEIIKELDPIFEIMGLNYVCIHMEEIKQETKESLTALGYDGELFYTQNFQVFEEYTRTYQKYMLSNPDKTYYFGENDYDFFLVLLMLIIEYKEEFSSIDHLTNEMINKQIIQICDEVFNLDSDKKSITTLEEIVLFLNKCNLADKSKWKLLQIMQQPQMHLLQLINIVESDMEAYKKAVKSIKSPLDKLLKQYQILMNEPKNDIFIEYKNKFAKDAKTYPAMVFPATLLLDEKNSYYGLLIDKLTPNEKGYSQSKESILSKLKALSDSSKLEIILALKDKPMYNLEIAKQLGLSAATMSHHMNVLLYCEFVYVEKKDGKVYYCIQEENLKAFIKELEKLFL